MRRLFCCAIISVFIPADLEAQALNSSPAELRSLQTLLEEVVRDEWVPKDRDPDWLTLKHLMNEELTHRPHEPLAALIRRAAAFVDVEVVPVVVRRNEQLNISLTAQPRFTLDTPIPYVVRIHASLDGGEWFQLGWVHGESGCGTSRNIVTPGFHHMQLVADVSFLRQRVSSSNATKCEISALEPEPRIVIQRERRVLPGVSFGIDPDLLGGSAILADTLEAGLPELTLARWLDSVFDAVPEARPTSKDSWTVEFCRPEESLVYVGPWLGGWRPSPAARRQSRDLCVNFLAAMPDNRMMTLRVLVGTLHQDAGKWSPRAPAFHDLSLGDGRNVVDVPYLGLLPSVLTMPAAAFPRLDLSVNARDIKYEPADAKPGDPIIITATVRNGGGRDAFLISGLIGLQAITPTSAVAARSFVADIPRDSSIHLSFRTTMPLSGEIVVQVALFSGVWMFRQGPYVHLRDVEPENNTATKPIGRPRR